MAYKQVTCCQNCLLFNYDFGDCRYPNSFYWESYSIEDSSQIPIRCPLRSENLVISISHSEMDG